ncbi:carboxylesterase family protein [Zwartia sp.]|uniref:carboxylesterase family protein n=1 Tax=Zwartia sp. TaxID=2978004 RepID=UPI003BB13489
MLRLRNALLIALITLASVTLAQSQIVVIKSPAGQLQGVKNLTSMVNEFKGIRYATAERFAKPIATPSWTGLKDAKTFGSNCPQTARYNLTEESLNEDCLYLNISTPSDMKPGEKLPVMIWIPGGGFVGGGSNLYRLDLLVQQGRMIVVSINYRLGLFGFMPHPAMDAASNGNLGLEDQREAMRWVQKNIAAFGGNPNNITIAGESAGSGSICQHLASPEHVSGLFHRAILISGACIQVLPTVQQALKDPIWHTVSHNPKDPARTFRCPVPGDSGYSDSQSLACLKSISVKTLLEAQTYEAGNRILSFVPVTGNQTVPRAFRDAVKSGQIVKVPMMIGGAKNELRVFVAYDVLGDNANRTKYPVTFENLKEYYLPAFYGSDQKKNTAILTHYFGSADNPKNLNGATLGSMLSDFNPHVGINNCLNLKTANALNDLPAAPAIYQFQFDDPGALVLGVSISKGKDPGFELGSVHSSILNYFFPRLSNTAAIDAPELSITSQQLGQQMIEYVSSFMRDGNPRAQGLAEWKKYDGSMQRPASDRVMFFSPGKIHARNAYGAIDASSNQGHQCGFWNALYPD